MWLYIVGAVVLVLALGTGVYLILDNNSGASAPIDTANGTQSPDPQQSDRTDTDPVPTDTDLVTDPATGLSYEAMGAPWETSNFGEIPGGIGTPVGEMLVTEENWVAVFLVGEMNPDLLDYHGVGDLETSLTGLADVVDEVNYAPDGKQLDGFQREGSPDFIDLKISGYTGKIMVYHLVWDDDRLDDQGEYVGLGLIDLGDGRLAGIQLSLPESAYEIYGDTMEDKVAGMVVR